MSDETLKIYELRREAAYLSDGRQKISMIEEAVRLADVSGDQSLQTEIRIDLVKSAVEGGEDEKAIVAFSWLVAKNEERPELTDTLYFLWYYKWIISRLHGFPHVRRSQIDAIFAGAIHSYTDNGRSLRPIYENLCILEMHSGNREKAAEYHQLWLLAARDFYADCAACESNTRATFEAFYGRDEEALEIARPILNGAMRCGAVPHCTYPMVLLPLIRLKRFDEAEEIFNKGYKLVAANRRFLGEVAEFLRFLILAGNTQTAVRMFEQHLLWALETKRLDNRLEFYNAAGLLFDKLASDSEETLTLSLPDSFKDFSEDGIYRIAALKDRFEKDALFIARLFDERNGNNFHAGLIGKNKELKKLAR